MAGTETKILDPVCGKEVGRDSPYKIEHMGISYYFCSEEHLKKFRDGKLMDSKIYQREAHTPRARKPKSARP